MNIFENAFSGLNEASLHTPPQIQPQVNDSVPNHEHLTTNFSKPVYDYVILDHHDQQISISLSAQLHGSFFQDSTSKGASNPGALTCYRRNIFYLTGNVILPRSAHCIMTSQGQRIPITSWELCVSAVESMEGNPAKIVSIPQRMLPDITKATTSDRIDCDPRSLPLVLADAQTVGDNFASFPFEWKRLRFRSATANNGRRNGLQQHYTIYVSIMARLATGQRERLCAIHSNPIIVRGRSPANFQPKRDSLSRTTSMKSHAPTRPAIAAPITTLSSSLDADIRSPVVESSDFVFDVPGTTPPQGGVSATGKVDAPFFATSNTSPLAGKGIIDTNQNTSYQAAPAHISISSPITLSLEDYMSQGPFDSGLSGMQFLDNGPSLKTLASGPRPPIPLSLFDEDEPPYRSEHVSVNEFVPGPSGRQGKRSCISLSLIDDEPPDPSGSSQRGDTTAIVFDRPVKRPRVPLSLVEEGRVDQAIVGSTPIPTSIPTRRPTDLSMTDSLTPVPRRADFSIGSLSSPDEAADTLYEYFPLSFDEWLPPVNAIYRPHAAHCVENIPNPSDPHTDGIVEGRSVRYFSDNPCYR
ncbi:p53-like transcription factor [Myriangium duriaei CBS 260.36]|uniref:P53-like transcription factor n=1 Tax=Myriangium duriaei CBS 260.36 TaxID=1168546 RepID=A0A9P4MR84_9PEZI|nr:p53-like transcription factor [Myriangium duriaei CBS 260.36]